MRQVAFEYLLYQIKRIHDLAYPSDQSILHCVKNGNVELNYASAGSAQIDAKIHHDTIAFGNHRPDVVPQLGIATMDRLPHRAHFGLAAMMTEMGQ